MAKANGKANGKAHKSKAVIDYDTIQKYKVHETKTGSGKRRAVDNNDKVAAALRGLNEKEWKRVAFANKVKVKNFEKLNAGLKRLALGNALRRVMRTDGKIDVLGKSVRA